jgi:hypothetical protein
MGSLLQTPLLPRSRASNSSGNAFATPTSESARSLAPARPSFSSRTPATSYPVPPNGWTPILLYRSTSGSTECSSVAEVARWVALFVPDPLPPPTAGTAGVPLLPPVAIPPLQAGTVGVPVRRSSRLSPGAALTAPTTPTPHFVPTPLVRGGICKWDNAMSPRRFPHAMTHRGGDCGVSALSSPPLPLTHGSRRVQGNPPFPTFPPPSPPPPFLSPHHLLVPLRSQFPRFPCCSHHCLASFSQTILPLSAS